MGKKELYSRIRLAGILSYVPLVLFSGPFLGYLAGDYLVKRTGLPAYCLLICIALGSLSSIIEVVRIIRLAKKLSDKEG
jgi:hypothetical protein